MPRLSAISFKLFQNSSSRLTLVLWPAMTIERLRTETSRLLLPNHHRTVLAANSLNLWPEQHSQRRVLRVFLGSPSGDRGRTAAAAEGPWSYLRDPTPGALTI